MSEILILIHKAIGPASPFAAFGPMFLTSRKAAVVPAIGESIRIGEVTYTVLGVEWLFDIEHAAVNVYVQEIIRESEG